MGDVRKDYKGYSVGRVVFGGPIKKGKNLYWETTCVCGKKWLTLSTKIPRTKGVGCASCYAKSRGRDDLRKRIARNWGTIKQRCFNANNTNFKHYGGRGITVCQEWLDVNVFIEWAIKTGYSPGLTLDRIDVNGDYAPNNCRWATKYEQMQNTRKNRNFVINGVKKSLSAWCMEYKQDLATVRKRLRNGKQILEALTIKPGSIWGNQYVKKALNKQSN